MDDAPSRTIGRTLEAARLGRGRTVAHAAAATDIAHGLIDSLEAGRFHDVGDQARVKGYVRTYARYLGLDPEPLLDQLTPTGDPPANEPAGPAPVGDRVGVSLRSARHGRGEEIQDVAAALNIESGILASLEAEDFEAAGGQVLAKAYLRRYARHLNLDAEALLDRYRVDEDEGSEADPEAPAPAPASEPAPTPGSPVAPEVERWQPEPPPRPVTPRRVATRWEPEPPPKRRLRRS